MTHWVLWWEQTSRKHSFDMEELTREGADLEGRKRTAQSGKPPKAGAPTMTASAGARGWAEGCWEGALQTSGWLKGAIPDPDRDGLPGQLPLCFGM